MRDLIGRTLGHYRIVEKIGEGGMGEVYRARDERLDRDVAVKVLPEEVAGVQDRLERFEREAKLLASLNHPNIATLHGLEVEDRLRYLVMELVEGESLAHFISRGPVPVDEALPIALQIAKALEAAHEHGIIHRDLKPANVMVDFEGQVKVLDFGLAKAFEPEGSGPQSPESLAESPTLTADMTRGGVLLGTAAYMSPEQASGKPVDKRADIWAFGCVLFEMLTAARAFGGATSTEVLAGIIKEEPGWDELPVETPTPVRRLLQRCLVKNQRNRIHAIADARIEIEEASASPPDDMTLAAPEAPHRKRLRTVVVLLAGVAVGALGVWDLIHRKPLDELPVTRFTIALPKGQRLGEPSRSIAISPDGVRLAYVAESGGQRQLYVRELSEFGARPVADTQGATSPFFSPDGQWVAFYADAKLKKAHVAGGGVVELCDVPPISEAPFGSGSAWTADGYLIFLAGGDLATVSEEGGVPEVLGAGEQMRWPHPLPDDRGLLVTVSSARGSELVLLAPGRQDRKVVLRGGSDTYQVSYLASGHLVYAEGERVLAAPFDLARADIGVAVPVLEGVQTDWVTARGVRTAFAVSPSGSAVYLAGEVANLTELVWVSRDGVASPLSIEPEMFAYPRLSSDGSRVAVQVQRRAGLSDIWVYDLERGTRTPLTDRSNNAEPVWTSDGRWVAHFKNGTIVRKTSVDGTLVTEELLTNSTVGVSVPSSWSPDDRELAIYTFGESTLRDIQVLVQNEGWTLRPILVTDANEHSPVFSPDGRWLAYVSDRTGREEVWVLPYPGPGPRHQVSAEGGREPMWSRDGRELFYRSGYRMMAATVTTHPGFTAALPRALFEGRYEMGQGGGIMYDITPDSSRFLMIRRPEGPAPGEIHVIQNWVEELKRLVPTE